MGIDSKSASISRGLSPAESHTGCGILHQTPQGHKDLRYLALGALEPDTGSWHQIKFLDLALVSLALLSFLILTASQPEYDVGERKWWQLSIWGSESLPRLVQRACASYFPVGSGYLASKPTLWYGLSVEARVTVGSTGHPWELFSCLFCFFDVFHVPKWFHCETVG